MTCNLKRNPFRNLFLCIQTLYNHSQERSGNLSYIHIWDHYTQVFITESPDIVFTTLFGLKCRKYIDDPWWVIRAPFNLVQSNCEVSDLCHLGLICTCEALSSSSLIQQKGFSVTHLTFKECSSSTTAFCSSIYKNLFLFVPHMRGNNQKNKQHI